MMLPDWPTKEALLAWHIGKICAAVILTCLTLYGALFIMGLSSPKATLGRVTQQQAALEQQVSEGKTRLSQATEFAAKVRVLQIRWQSFNRQLLPTNHSAKVIEIIGHHARDASIDLDDVEWLAEKQKTDFVLVPLKLRVSGGYINIRHFFRLLALDEQLITVEEVTVERVSVDSERLTAMIQLSMYRSLDSAPLTASLQQISPSSETSRLDE
jgi:Tfp pilus assembly protein PilO